MKRRRRKRQRSTRGGRQRQRQPWWRRRGSRLRLFRSACSCRRIIPSISRPRSLSCSPLPCSRHARLQLPIRRFKLSVQCRRLRRLLSRRLLLQPRPSPTQRHYPASPLLLLLLCHQSRVRLRHQLLRRLPRLHLLPVSARGRHCPRTCCRLLSRPQPSLPSLRLFPIDHRIRQMLTPTRARQSGRKGSVDTSGPPHSLFRPSLTAPSLLLNDRQQGSASLSPFPPCRLQPSRASLLPLPALQKRQATRTRRRCATAT